VGVKKEGPLQRRMGRSLQLLISCSVLNLNRYWTEFSDNNPIGNVRGRGEIRCGSFGKMAVERTLVICLSLG
jgi:hypothetical protein